MIAGAFDDTEMSVADGEQQTRAGFQKMVAANRVFACCRICESVKFHYETRKTPFRTMQEAVPAMAAVQAANIGSGDFIEALRQHRNPH
jgi:hypothetical protein